MPNQRRRLVRLGDIYDGRPKGSSPLPCWLGKDVSGQAVWTDLALMPHAWSPGTTGSGKSGCINAMLCSILLHASPNEARLVLVDPKRVELNHYEQLPHLLTPVVTNPRLAANVLANLIGEMESRYAVMGEARARNLVELNRARARPARPPLPHILCVIDELADLMMVAPAEVEDSIIRLAQKSRAVGIHLVLATQRPSTDVITGTIKVNIPARIAFAVASQVDSRVILDQGGAETLLGQGDMLFRPVGTSKLQRIQGAFVTEDEIASVSDHWAKQGEPEFDQELLEAREEPRATSARAISRPTRTTCSSEAARIVVQSRDRLRVDDPAPPAGRLHARRPPDRHARAPRDHLRLRGLQAAPGAGHRGGALPRLSRHGGGADDGAEDAEEPTADAPETDEREPVSHRRLIAPLPRTHGPPAARICAAMVTRHEGEGLPIGEVLKRSRNRQKIDIQTVEERDQDQGQVPARARERGVGAPSRARPTPRGSCAPTASSSGLDTDALVDEYRRSIESSPAAEQPYPFSRAAAGAAPQAGTASSAERAGQALAIVGILAARRGRRLRIGPHAIP